MKNKAILEKIIQRAHYLANQMIYTANHRSNKQKGDPKVGGHCSGASSSIHILGALHLMVRDGFDHICNKPHASPADHSFHYLLDLFLDENKNPLEPELAKQAMAGLRAFSQNGEPVFQSYHSTYDSDHFNFLPSGSVGIPPVSIGYLALAYRFFQNKDFQVPKAHFWAIIGDSEFREGSLLEAAPDLAERRLGNLTWIVDYNRQSLDGHRIIDQEVFFGSDADRIENTMKANGWDVIQVRHGSLRQKAFQRPGGKAFQNWLEKSLSDYELQSLLLCEPEKRIDYLKKQHPALKEFLDSCSHKELTELLWDLGGHDLECLVPALLESKKNPDRPCAIIAHTVKGWGLEMAGTPGNHNAMIDKKELEKLQKQQGLSELFGNFDSKTPEKVFLEKRGEELRQIFLKQEQMKKSNEDLLSFSDFPPSFDVNLKMASFPHTQWMMGQILAKLSRISQGDIKSDSEKPWKEVGNMFVNLAPDVGTSTNLNPLMDGRIFGHTMEDKESLLGVKDSKTPDLTPSQVDNAHYVRFEIAEANALSCAGAFGKLQNILGIPAMPLVSIYDFFVKRALDQHFYNLYWKSSFILLGTPAGVTLSPEGAQHCWKSDIQIPGQITWEPFFCQEMEWIVAESLRRHFFNDNLNRTGVHIRAVTRGAEQKDFLKRLKTSLRFKETPSAPLHHPDFPLDGATNEANVPAIEDHLIWESTRQDTLNGAYFLVDYRGYAGYEPGDNVVNIISMGSPTTEALTASDALLVRGIYANVIVITSPDLTLGALAHGNDYHHLKQTLDLHLNPSPVVSVHDGEPGLLDNLGSVTGVLQKTLATRKHSLCGTPQDVYKYHNLDWESIQDAALEVLTEAALSLKTH